MPLIFTICFQRALESFDFLPDGDDANSTIDLDKELPVVINTLPKPSSETSSYRPSSYKQPSPPLPQKTSTQKNSYVVPEPEYVFDLNNWLQFKLNEKKCFVQKSCVMFLCLICFGISV